MKKIFAVLLCLTLMIFAGCNSTNDKALVVGMIESPLGYRNDKGEFIGFEFEFAKEVGKRMNVPVEFKIIDWDKKEDELDSGNIDIIWNGLDITPERQKRILFSKPYMENRQIILVRKDTGDDIRHVEDLAGKVVGVEVGSTGAIYFDKNEKLKTALAELKTYDNYQNAFAALKDGEIDFLIVDEILGRYELKKSGDELKLIDITVGPVTKLGIGFRKDDTELRDKVEKFFGEMVKDGTAKKISEKWFQADLIKFKL